MRRAWHRWREKPGVPLAATLVLAAFAGLAAVYAAAVPPLGAPDESFHLGYARLIADHASLPGPLVNERQQPPLFYLLAALVLRLGGDPHAVRLISVGMGTIAVGVTMLVGAELLGRPALGVITGALVGALPVTAAVSGTLSDDATALAVGALLVLLTIRALRRPQPAAPLELACGIAAGLGLLAKETDWPLVVVLYGALAWRWRGRLRFADIARLGATVIAVGGWWFVRNLTVFGRPTPPLSTLHGASNRLDSVGQVRSFVSGTLRSLVGPERGDGAVLPRPAWALLLAALLGAMTTGLLAVTAARAVRGFGHLRSVDRAVVVAMVSAMTLVAVAHVLQNVLNDLQPQARYLMVAASIPATAVVSAGVWLWARRPTWAVAGTAVAAALLMAVGADALLVAARRSP